MIPKSVERIEVLKMLKDALDLIMLNHI